MSFSDSPITWTYPTFYNGKVAYVAFYCYDPERKQLRRKRYMLTRFKTKKKRKVMAAQLIANILLNLQNGWNPWVDSNKLPKLAKFEEIPAQYRIATDRRYMVFVLNPGQADPAFAERCEKIIAKYNQ